MNTTSLFYVAYLALLIGCSPLSSMHITPLKQETIDVAVCSICLEDIGPGETVLTCGHQFHTPCIDEWLSTANICPNCRNPVRSKKLYASNSPTPLFYSAIPERYRDAVPTAHNTTYQNIMDSVNRLLDRLSWPLWEIERVDS